MNPHRGRNAREAGRKARLVAAHAPIRILCVVCPEHEDHQVRLEAFRTPKLPRAIEWHIRLASGRASAAKVHHNKILAEPFIKQRGIIATAFVRRPGGAKRLVRAVAACQAVAEAGDSYRRAALITSSDKIEPRLAEDWRFVKAHLGASARQERDRALDRSTS